VRSLPRSLVAIVAIALAFASIIALAPGVAAAQNRPSWTQGDFWVYTRTAGTATSTIRVDVLEKTTLTLNSGTRTVWHVTTTTTPASGSARVQHSWVEDGTLAVAKANFTAGILGEIQVTFDPPFAQAVFPLAVNSEWSLNTTLRAVGISFTLNIAYSGKVIDERSTTVAAGTFTVAVVRTPSSGAAHDENSYSDNAGNNVKQESYDGNGNRVASQELTSWRYQATGFALVLIGIGIAAIAAIAIVAFVLVRRQRRGMPPPPGMYPPAPPQQPPTP
jgi:hypothetical protein